MCDFHFVDQVPYTPLMARAFSETPQKLPYAKDLESLSSKLNVAKSKESLKARIDPSIPDINFLGMLSMHSHMGIDDICMQNIQIGFWNPLKKQIDDDLKRRGKRCRSKSDNFLYTSASVPSLSLSGCGTL